MQDSFYKYYQKKKRTQQLKEKAETKDKKIIFKRKRRESSRGKEDKDTKTLKKRGKISSKKNPQSPHLEQKEKLFFVGDKGQNSLTIGRKLPVKTAKL